MVKYNVSMREKEPGSLVFKIDMLRISVEAGSFIEACQKAEDHVSKAFGVPMVADGGYEEYQDIEVDKAQ